MSSDTLVIAATCARLLSWLLLKRFLSHVVDFWSRPWQVPAQPLSSPHPFCLVYHKQSSVVVVVVPRRASDTGVQSGAECAGTSQNWQGAQLSVSPWACWVYGLPLALGYILSTSLLVTPKDEACHWLDVAYSAGIFTQQGRPLRASWF